MRKLIFLILVILVLAFFFSDTILYYASRWHERTGNLKRALEDYIKLVENYPQSRWAKQAKAAIERLKDKLASKEQKEEKKEESSAPYTGEYRRAKSRLKQIEEKRNQQIENELE